MAITTIPVTLRNMFTWGRARPMTELNDYFALDALPSTATVATTYVVANFDLASLTERFVLRLPILYTAENAIVCVRYIDEDDNVFRYRLTGSNEEILYTGQIIEPTRAAIEIWSDGSGNNVSAPETFLPIGKLQIRTSSTVWAGTEYDTTLCINTTGSTGGFEDYATTCYI
jgi:hypothetical protein